MSLKHLLGTKLEFESELKEITIDYKHGSILGVGGDKSQKYNVAKYRASGLNNSEILVFVQQGLPVKETKTIDKNFQFGVDGGIVFLVEHDAERRSHGIYQWRFTKAVGGESGLKGLAIKAASGLPIDVSWIAGDPLRDF